MASFDSMLSRRQLLRVGAVSTAVSMSGWLGQLASAVEKTRTKPKRSCILLWMSGGPSQMDTFDLKPDHANGGPFKAAETSVPGIRISEHFPQVGKLAKHLAIVRSMNSKEGDHGRATYLLRTGYVPQGPVQYPSLGALVSKELGEDDAALPGFVSVAPFRVLNQGAFGSGFLGPRYAPLIVGEGAIAGPQAGPNADRALRVQDLAPPADINRERADARLDLLKQVQRDFASDHPDAPAGSHQSAYEGAVRLMRTAAAKAFDLEEEKAAVRDAYGRNLFGQGCLLARRLVEKGVPFIEVTLNGWDTHANNAQQVRALSQTVDPAWASLMTDLADRGLLDTTLIVWMGEFGRTPKFGRADGRDHWPNTFSAVLAGGGIKGGQVIGATSEDGASVKERPVSVPELLATVCRGLGIDHEKQNLSNVGRPIRVVAPGAQPVQEALA